MLASNSFPTSTKTYLLFTETVFSLIDLPFQIRQQSWKLRSFYFFYLSPCWPFPPLLNPGTNLVVWLSPVLKIGWKTRLGPLCSTKLLQQWVQSMSFNCVTYKKPLATIKPISKVYVCVFQPALNSSAVPPPTLNEAFVEELKSTGVPFSADAEDRVFRAHGKEANGGWCFVVLF